MGNGYGQRYAGFPELPAGRYKTNGMNTENRRFTDIIQGDKPVLVDFFTEWSGSCITMKSILEELIKRVGNNAVILNIDVDKNPAMAAAYGVNGIPTLLLFRHGQVKWRRSGLVQASQLDQLLEKYN